MTLSIDQIKYTRCQCGRSYPLASWIDNRIKGSTKLINEPAVFKAHNRKRCVPCLRAAGEL